MSRKHISDFQPSASCPGSESRRSCGRSSAPCPWLDLPKNIDATTAMVTITATAMARPANMPLLRESLGVSSVRAWVIGAPSR